MSRPSAPSFFRPLRDFERGVVELYTKLGSLRKNIARHNSSDHQALEDILTDLNATLIEAKQLTAKARELEKAIRRARP